MGSLARHVERLRRKLSQNYLCGNGIEIGALHQPLAVGANARVKYVDRLPTSELRHHYPELAKLDLVNVDIVDDGQVLSLVPEDSLDFVIANHVLEHCPNPLGALNNHFRKLKIGGILYLAIPDMRFSFDRFRKPTEFQHLLWDAEDNGDASRAEHFREWASLVNGITDPDGIEERAAQLMKQDYSIHFHVWSAANFLNFLASAQRHLGNTFEIVEVRSNWFEIIAILRKRDPSPPFNSSSSKTALALGSLRNCLNFRSWLRWTALRFHDLLRPHPGRQPTVRRKKEMTLGSDK